MTFVGAGRIEQLTKDWNEAQHTVYTYEFDLVNIQVSCLTSTPPTLKLHTCVRVDMDRLSATSYHHAAWSKAGLWSLKYQRLTTGST